MNSSQKGFTLVELLIVIALIAVLSVAIILALNPAELLKQGRDSTRISDLGTVNSALSLFFVDVATSSMPSGGCYVHVSSGMTNCNQRFNTSSTPVTSTSQAINGTGWIPINLTLMTTGTPLPRYPIDPTNDNTYYYAFRASTTPTGIGFYEINARLESTKYSPQAANDGGSSSTIYEVGTDLSL
jgi:prepilin-type N-terminal cleavage/methylation domain-containing protein